MKLDSYYQKRLNPEDLDERFYLKEKKPHTPGKFTPFAKQGAANKNNININITKGNDLQIPKKTTYTSHRMLNYEISEQVTMKSNLNDIVSVFDNLVEFLENFR